MEQRKDTVEDLGRTIKETVPAELKERVEQAIQDSIKMVEKGKRYVEHVKARLEFISADSESGSYQGPTGKGAAASSWRQAAEEFGEESRTVEANKGGPEGLASVFRVWGQLKANAAVGRLFMAVMPVTRDSRESGRPTERHTTLW
jgi:hypothetical protein